MSLLFGKKFKDEELIAAAENALSDEPTLNVSNLTVTSEKGIVTLGGQLSSTMAKRRAIEAVERAFQRKGLKYDKLIDDIMLS